MLTFKAHLVGQANEPAPEPHNPQPKAHYAWRTGKKTQTK